MIEEGVAVYTLDWAEVDGESYHCVIEKPYTKKGYFAIDSQIKHLKSLKSLESWFIVDKKTNALLGNSGSAPRSQLAKVLYDRYKNYAKVARVLEVHPTTVRNWIKDESNN